MTADDRVYLDFSHLDSREGFAAHYSDLEHAPGIMAVTYGLVRMQFFKPDKGDTILDLGCGTGGNAIFFGLRGHRCVGIDISAGRVRAGVEAIERDYPQCQGLVDLRTGFIEDVCLDERFNHVLLTEVLEHVIDPVIILDVARRHLKPDGEVYISAPAIRTGGADHARGVPEADLFGWLDAAGLIAVWSTEQRNVPLGASYPQTICRAKAKGEPCAS